eukprot:g22552.t1
MPLHHGDLTQDTIYLFDHFGRQAEIIFRPYCGLWRLRDLFEVLVACRQQDGLTFAEPSLTSHGGLRLPRSEELTRTSNRYSNLTKLVGI